MRYLVAAVLLLLSTAAFGATADLAVSITAPKVADADYFVIFRIDVTNNGPDRATGVHIKAGGAFVAGIRCFDKRDFDLEPHQSGFKTCAADTPRQNGIATLGATVTSNATDPDPSNNAATADMQWIVGPNLGTGVFAAHPVIDPGLPFELIAQYWNTSAMASTNVVMTIDLPEGTTVKSQPENCNQLSQRLVCSLGTVPGGSHSGRPTILRFTLLAPDRREGATLSSHITIAGTEPEGMLENNEYTSQVRLFRTFIVENTNDSGAGSLRNAMETANASCGDAFPCKVAFRVPSDGVVTIKPESPLPEISGLSVDIDGTTQTRMLGDTNPAGPEIFIDGSRLTEGNGFVIATACNANIIGMAIGNFPESGVLIIPEGTTCRNVLLDPYHQIAQNYIGVDATGSNPAPNARGVVIANFEYEGYSVIRNVISANRRSGVFIQSIRTWIYDNIIGLDPQHRADLGNGASGVYVSKNTFDTNISGNFIAFNHDFGVAIEQGASGVDVKPNSIFANWQMGIDNGLDGPTAAPEITSAAYDPATDSTLIDVSYTDQSTFGPTLQFYASDAPHRSGYGDGQYYLGTATPKRGEEHVRFAARGDWRGKWIAATITHNTFYGFGIGRPIAPLGEGADTRSSTSEFSRAVEAR